jgi:hypothetical protein
MDRPYEDVIIVTVKPVVDEPEVPAQTDSTAAEAAKEE